MSAMITTRDVMERSAARLSSFGLILRGGLNFSANDDAPAGPSGDPARAVLLVGHGGAGYWPVFARWHAANPARAHPLDDWSREVIDAVAGDVGARAVYPGDRPYLPFQSWAMRAEGLRASPLGVLMHPEFGLWHAYRGALLFDAEIPIQEARSSNHPCDLCIGKPCLKACPADAISPASYDVPRCRDHVREAGSRCRTGCLSRNACPVGAAYRYPGDVQAFHMASFLAG